jgi:hypothetical protein
MESHRPALQPFGAGAARAHDLPRGRIMHRSLRLVSAIAIVVAAATVVLPAAEAGKRDFITAWQNRSVVLKRTLFSVVYDERSRVLSIWKQEGKVAGLTVGTPSATYYQFEARREAEEDILANDPNVILSTLRDQYRRSSHLEIGNVQDVEPLMLVRYEPGVELVVKKVQIERDRVRLLLHKSRASDLATTLTVKWPVPLTKELTESAIIEDVITRYVTRR